MIEVIIKKETSIVWYSFLDMLLAHFDKNGDIINKPKYWVINQYESYLTGIST